MHSAAALRPWLAAPLAAWFALAGGAASAQPAPHATGPIVELRLDGTPSMFVDGAGRVTGCGLRVFGIESLPPPADRHRTVDVSFLMGVETITRGVGLVKAVSMEAGTAALQGREPMRPLPLIDAWLRAPGAERSAPRESLAAAANDPNALTYLTDASALFAVADAALAGKPIEASVVRAQQAVHPIYRGVLSMDESARQRFVVCMRALQDVAGVR